MRQRSKEATKKKEELKSSRVQEGKDLTQREQRKSAEVTEEKTEEPARCRRYEPRERWHESQRYIEERRRTQEKKTQELPLETKGGAPGSRLVS